MSTKGEMYFPIGTSITDTNTKTIYKIKSLLGRGAYAQCVLVETIHGSQFALKIIQKSSLKSEKLRQKVESEIQIHQSLNHPGIVKMYSSFRTELFIFMVLELCEKGAMDDLLKKIKKIPEKNITKMIFQIIKALEYLHDFKHVVHRDLKLGNLFIDKDANVKLGDFGLSAIIQNGEKRKTVCGTPNYIAPEVLFGKASGHSFGADIWSLGVITYTLLIGTPPFQESSVEEIYRRIEQNKYIFPENCEISKEARDFISKILISDPEFRPDLKELLEHKFLSSRGQLVKRIYKNVKEGFYNAGPILEDYVTYTFPIDKIKGIGYIMKSGICGIFYQNNVNVFITRTFLRIVQIKNNNKRIFVYDDFPIQKIPHSHRFHFENIRFFIETHTSLDFRKMSLPDLPVKSFIAKTKIFSGGFLFVMTSNIFIFDFGVDLRVVIADEGRIVNAIDDDANPIEFDMMTKDKCLSILNNYIK